ncbi:DUF2851 family protein [Winogradskyella sp.]|nr:DUF2851 family protein [Winogradskyella sp.]MDC1504549.1 DUF2851 family protein [Winogradskyella sp.]
MQEDFLHYIWKHKAFNTNNLKTTKGEVVKVSQLGLHNLNAGPDFFNATLAINNQLWAGNVEIHIKSSDWYVHNHQVDAAYDNVILHVVWEHDTEIFRKDNTEIPTLELKLYVNQDLQNNYQKLMQSKSWINCEKDFSDCDDFLLNNWLERLYIERLEKKAETIDLYLKRSNNNWEAVLFKMLLKNFGLKINGDSFLSLANSIDFSVIRKLQNDVLDLEALFFGQSALLTADVEDSYFINLKARYKFLKQKFKLNNQGVLQMQFFRLRPPNFPTIRLSQFANLYVLEQQLFSKVIHLNTKAEFYEVFKNGPSIFWTDRYTFSKKSSKVSKKNLTKSFIDLLIINTIIPLKFSYAKSLGKSIDSEVFNLIKELKIENNTVVSKFLELKPIEKSALSSQALLQLKQHYCDANKCLQCAIGNSLIVKK